MFGRYFGVMWIRQTLMLLAITCFLQTGWSQADTIFLKNPSFEDIPRHSQGVKGWIDCGWDTETAPDVQPFKSLNAEWGQQIPAIKGNTYLGLVVRENDTYERVGQRLSSPLIGGQCYTFSIYLSSSDQYLSATKRSKGALHNYTQPAVLRISGGVDYCLRSEVLAESPTIDNTVWQRYDFQLHPTMDYEYILIEAFYKTPALVVYNGNVLVDGASEIVRIECPEEQPPVVVTEIPLEEIFGEEEPPVAIVEKLNERKRQQTAATPPTPDPPTPPKQDDPIVAAPAKKPSPAEPTEKVLNLDRKKLAAGQTIRIENLYFDADSATIDPSSFDVLKEIAYFLSQNQDIVVEIGGHTNGIPPHEFCDRLSNDRAQAVAGYIIAQGISDNQIKHRGYGKRKPITSNHTKWGRQRNQRVEIRILSFDG